MQEKMTVIKTFSVKNKRGKEKRVIVSEESKQEQEWERLAKARERTRKTSEREERARNKILIDLWFTILCLISFQEKQLFFRYGGTWNILF